MGARRRDEAGPERTPGAAGRGALRAAVVGCGALATGAHLATIRGSDLFELRAVCDTDAAAAARAEREFGAARRTADWRDVVDADDVDLVVLCTHTNLRAELIDAACRRGKPVYVEKPLAKSLPEMRRIVRACDETGVPVCVGHNRRSSPAVLEFKRLLDKARAEGTDRAPLVDRSDPGRRPLPEEAQMQLLLRVNDDARSWKRWVFEDEDGIMLVEMVHFVDLALWLNAAPPVEVYACGSPRGNFTEIIRFGDGSIATLVHTMVGSFDYPKELFEASARNVTVALDHHMEVRQRGLESEPFRTLFGIDPAGDGRARGIELYHEEVDRLHGAGTGGAGGRPPACLSKGHREHLEGFARHVAGDGPNPCPVEGAVVATTVALRLLESCRLGLPVRIGPEDIDPVRAEPEGDARHSRAPRQGGMR